MTDQTSAEVGLTAYAWRWKGSDTWKLTFTKKPNHHPGIEIKALFETPPQARLDAEWDACVEAAAEVVGRLQRQDVTDSEGFVPPDRFDEGTDAAYEMIRALRRSGKGE